MPPPERTHHLRPVLSTSPLAQRWWTVVGCGGTLVVLFGQHVGVASVRQPGPVLWLMLGLILLGELRPIVTSGNADPNGVNLSMAFIFATMILWGPPLAVVVAFAATAISETAKRKKFWIGLYNACQYAFSYAVAGGLLWLMGVQGSPASATDFHGRHLVAVFLAAAVYHVVNLTLVAVLLSAESGTTFREELFDDIVYYTVTTLAVMSVAPLIAAVQDEGVVFILLLILPLFAVWRTAQMSLQQEHRSLHDPLTGLPNRTLLSRKVETAVEEIERNGTRGALLLLDLDRFKEINDTLGHLVGDELLQAVAGRLAGAVRGVDTVARLGGDEFAVLLAEIDGLDPAIEVAERIATTLAEPLHAGELVIEVRASVGVAMIPEHGAGLSDLLRCADVAMYEAKHDRSGVEVYSAERDRNSPGRLSLLAELRRALRMNELVLHYQPKIDIADGAVVGVEGLLRWEHPVRGLVPPDEFLPLAEHAGLMPELTERVLALAMAQARAWRDAGTPVQVAVNVTTRDLADGRLPERVATGLRRHALPINALRLEVTEDTLMSDRSRTLDSVAALEALGVPLSLDDFGTGHSSLSRLKELPVTELKIDRRFVREMATDDVAIVRSIVSLARAFGIPTVAEGVETPAQLEILRHLGCTIAQGFLIARPQPADALTVWLASREVADTSVVAALPA